jgi:hypothetical protein
LSPCPRYVYRYHEKLREGIPRAARSKTGTTWQLLSGYLLAGALVLLAVRFLVGRISVEQLGGDR